MSFLEQWCQKEYSILRNDHPLWRREVYLRERQQDASEELPLPEREYMAGSFRLQT